MTDGGDQFQGWSQALCKMAGVNGASGHAAKGES
jgi:hypothetical protein